MVDFQKLLEERNMREQTHEEKNMTRQAHEDETMREHADKNRKNSTIERTETWINKTDSGRGFIIFVKEDFKEGDILLGGITAMQEFINGERTGINLGIIIEEDNTGE